MASATLAANTLPKLENYDLRVLQAVELGMIHHRQVPVEEITRFSGLNPREVEFRLGKLHRLELVFRYSEPFVGYLLNYAGYDLLALNAAVKAGVLEFLGPSIGVGKESDVYEGVDPRGGSVAVKFHRLGRTSFRDTKRKREYVADRRHTSWLYQSRLAAQTEHQFLTKMHEAGVRVPKPLYQNRHMLVMEHVVHTPLLEAELTNPQGVLREILEELKKAYRAGVIHGDFSEYNVMVDEEGRPWIIDWPQAVETSHPNAGELLRRDLHNILGFFKRKYGLSLSLEEALEYLG